MADKYRYGKSTICRSQTNSGCKSLSIDLSESAVTDCRRANGPAPETVCQPASSVAVFIMIYHKLEDPLVTKTGCSRGLTFIGGSRWWSAVTSSYLPGTIITPCHGTVCSLRTAPLPHATHEAPAISSRIVRMRTASHIGFLGWNLDMCTPCHVCWNMLKHTQRIFCWLRTCSTPVVLGSIPPSSLFLAALSPLNTYFHCAYITTVFPI